MTDRTTILVPIRYPLTQQSAHTLRFAAKLAREATAAELVVLHVNLFQTNDKARMSEISQSIVPLLDGVEATVLTRRGFLVEDVILEEAAQTEATTVVVGANQRPTWRKLLSRLTGNEIVVADYLRERLTNVEIVEVNSQGKTPAATTKRGANRSHWNRTVDRATDLD
ncbi:universal stress protein [Haladaptatus sp. CMSO5]|uniref:universal stress protein n=1 Tax=Haladaptatus sp. CMSO5 TaxID=3120514 RepID=UPI002FCE36D6